jgi:hypothetical protein
MALVAQSAFLLSLLSHQRHVCILAGTAKIPCNTYLHTVVDFLLARNVLLRSEFRLAAEFPDFFIISLPGEGPTPCFSMLTIIDNGKMNPLGGWNTGR